MSPKTAATRPLSSVRRNLRWIAVIAASALSALSAVSALSSVDITFPQGCDSAHQMRRVASPAGGHAPATPATSATPANRPTPARHSVATCAVRYRAATWIQIVLVSVYCSWAWSDLSWPPKPDIL